MINLYLLSQINSNNDRSNSQFNLNNKQSLKDRFLTVKGMDDLECTITSSLTWCSYHFITSIIKAAVCRVSWEYTGSSHASTCRSSASLKRLLGSSKWICRCRCSASGVEFVLTRQQRHLHELLVFSCRWGQWVSGGEVSFSDKTLLWWEIHLFACDISAARHCLEAHFDFVPMHICPTVLVLQQRGYTVQRKAIEFLHQGIDSRLSSVSSRNEGESRCTSAVQSSGNLQDHSVKIYQSCLHSFLISDFWFMISSHHISSQLYSSREIWSDQLQAKLMIWLAPWHLPPTHRMMPFREGTGHLSNSSFIIPPLAPTNWSLPHINHVGWVTNVIAHWGFLPLRAMHVTGRITQVLRIGKKYRMRKYTLVLKVSRLESEQWSTFVACLNFMSIMPWSTTGSLELLFGDMHVWWA